MEEKQIIEGNKLIAEFDGWKVEPFDIDASEDNITGDDDWLVLNQYDSSGKRVRQIDGWECANIEANELETLPYNTSWDWLMPVWFKFRDHTIVDVPKVGLLTNYIAQIAERLAFGDINQVYNKLTEAIQWYNSTHNK